MSVDDKQAAPVDFYTLIHKALRRLLFNMSLRVATMDFNGCQATSQLNTDFLALIEMLDAHAEHEEKFFHPLLLQWLPDAYAELHTEHDQQKQTLTELDQMLKAILAKCKAGEDCSALGTNFYRYWNIFIGDYLQHLAEEEQVMPRLWQCCTAGDLMQALGGLLQSLSKEELLASVDYMLPAANLSEQVGYVSGLRMMVDEKTFMTICARAQQVLSASNWQKLSAALNG